MAAESTHLATDASTDNMGQLTCELSIPVRAYLYQAISKVTLVLYHGFAWTYKLVCAALGCCNKMKSFICVAIGQAHTVCSSF